MADKVLVVDDDKAILTMLHKALKSNGIENDLAISGEAALELLSVNKYDLILLDINMRGINGFEVIQRIRAKGLTTPVMVVSGRKEDQDALYGLEIGADDYITKPFSMEELTLRMEAILRRVHGKKNREVTVYQIGKFTFDAKKQILSIGDKSTKLTTKESELLNLLCAHQNEILQRDFALKSIWIDDNYFNARSMDVYITKLRKHLKDDDSVEIINIHGKGYKLIAPEAE